MGRIFERAEQYLDKITANGKWLEIGCGRAGDDGSTQKIAKWAEERDKRLITVDIDPHHTLLVQLLNLPNVDVVNDTGENFLKTFPCHTSYISFLYLDNFDWDWHPEKSEDFVLDQQKRYADLGKVMNNVNSQRAHLAQMMAALPVMAPSCLVVCDDTWFNKWWGHYSGKCGAVIPFLLNNGFEVLETEEQPVYGTIMGRGLSGHTLKL
jgi:hypothetical protein